MTRKFIVILTQEEVKHILFEHLTKGLDIGVSFTENNFTVDLNNEIKETVINIKPLDD